MKSLPTLTMVYYVCYNTLVVKYLTNQPLIFYMLVTRSLLIRNSSPASNVIRQQVVTVDLINVKSQAIHDQMVYIMADDVIRMS